MGYSFSYDPQVEQMLQSIAANVSVNSSISWVLSVAAYIFTALGLYTIATRRGLKKAWLAWVPLVDVWILGSISDQYRYVTRGQNKAKRVILLVLNVIQTVMTAAAVVCGIVVAVNGLMNARYQQNHQTLMNQLFGLLGLLILTLIVVVVRAVVYYMALHDVYASCEPKNKTVYLVLSILPGVSTVAVPLFLFLCREKDGGMPPRREIPCPVSEEPIWEHTVSHSTPECRDGKITEPREPWENGE